MSLEGVTSFTTFDREESVSETRIVHGSAAAVERALFESPRFDRVRPLYLRAGFPSPVSTRIDRSADRVRWVIELRGGEMRLNGMEARTGDLILELEEARPGPGAMARRFRHQSHDALSEVARGRRAVGADRRGHDKSDVDAALPPRSRSGVVLRTDGTVRRGARRGISD